jgi:hypothetical protein
MDIVLKIVFAFPETTPIIAAFFLAFDVTGNIAATVYAHFAHFVTGNVVYGRSGRFGPFAVPILSGAIPATLLKTNNSRQCRRSHAKTEQTH